MENLQFNARQIMMTCQQLKIASAQNDAAMEDEMMKQLKALADDVVTNDESWSRFIPYVTAIKAIYDVYEQRSDLFNSCELAIESLRMMAPLAEYINQEKPASMLTYHLDLALYPMYQMHLKMVSQNIEHDISPITLLADLLKANAQNLCQINPKNPLVAGLYRHVDELEEAGMTGSCGDMELSLYPCIILLGDLWDESKSKYQAYHGSQTSTLSNEEASEMFEILMGCRGRFGIPDNVDLDERNVDMILSPIYESIKSAIDYDNIVSDFGTQNPLSEGFSFARAFYNFSYYYSEYCNFRGIVPSTLSQLYIDEAIPYCPSSVVKKLHEEVLSCFLLLAETIGLTKDELQEKLKNDDAMLDMAEVSEEHLQLVIVSLVETNIWAEGVVLSNLGMALKAMKFDDKVIADKVNDFIQNMNQRKYLKEMPRLFKEHDITAVFRKVHYNR